MKAVEEFFREIDLRWKWCASGILTLRVIGCSALLMQTPYARGTKDSDIFEMKHVTPELQENILGLAGPHSALHRKYRMYVEFVAAALPFLPRKPIFHELKELNASLNHFRIEALDVVDVVVSKLKPFRPHDVDDIRAVADMGLLTHEKLLARFREAVDAWQMDSRAEDLPECIDHLHVVERDILFADETPIGLPEWLEVRLQG